MNSYFWNYKMPLKLVYFSLLELNYRMNIRAFCFLTKFKPYSCLFYHWILFMLKLRHFFSLYWWKMSKASETNESAFTSFSYFRRLKDIIEVDLSFAVYQGVSFIFEVEFSLCLRLFLGFLNLRWNRDIVSLFVDKLTIWKSSETNDRVFGFFTKRGFITFS